MMTGVYLRPIPDRRNNRSRQELVQRVRREFEELPAHRLTCAQLQRLFGLRVDICERVLAALVADGVLSPGPEGWYELNTAASTVSRAASGQPARSKRAGQEECDAAP